MGTTTKMAIPYPEATGLVKDGWEDMKDIATQVDAKSGLVLLNTTSFSAVASQSINDVFSTNYANYKIFLNTAGSTTLSIQFRLRVSGADNTTSNYQRQYASFVNATSYLARATSANIWNTEVEVTASNNSLVILDLLNPFASAFTGGYLTTGSNFNGTNIYLSHSALGFNATTSFTGYTIIASTGTITGDVWTYGYNK